MAILMENTDLDFGKDELGESDDGKDSIDKVLAKINELVQKMKPGKIRNRLEDVLDSLAVDENAEEDIGEKEELLPDCVVNEAVEMLRRMR